MATPRKQPASSLGVGITSLMLACQQELEADVHGLLERKREAIVQKDRSGKTALHYCAENTRTTCAEQILSARPEILNAQDDEGYSALHLAVISGNTTMVQFLVDQKAEVDCEDNEKHTCVHWATVCGELECLDIMTRAGANPSTPDIHGAFPIHYAAQMCGPNSEMGNDVKRGLQVLHKLISKGVDVNCRDQDGRTPLLWAASSETRASKTYCPSGSSDAIVSLVKAGADVHARDKDGLTALHCAASRGHLDCLETLITLCGAEVDAEDSNGCSALFYAVTLGHADCTNLLLGFGANSNLQDSKGRTAAHCGASKGQLETLRILGQHRTNLWIRNIRGDTPLHEAALSGRKELVEWLLEQLEGSVNVTNVNGRTPLHIAAITNNVELCKVLMDYGAFVNPIMKNSKGRLLTPLDAALYRGYRGCAKYLQLHGALPSSKVVERKEVYRTEVMPEPPPSVPEKWQRVYRESAVQTDTAQRDVDIQVHLSQTERESGKEENVIPQCLTERRREGILKDPRKPIVAKVYLHTKRRERRPTRRAYDEARRKYDTPLPQDIKQKRTRIFHHTTTSTSSKSNVPSPQKRPVLSKQVSRTLSSHGEEAVSEKVRTVKRSKAPLTDNRMENGRKLVKKSHSQASSLCRCCPDPYQDADSLPSSCGCDCHTRIPPTPKPETEHQQKQQEEFVVEMQDNMRSLSKQSNAEVDPDSQVVTEGDEVPILCSPKNIEDDNLLNLEKAVDIAKEASDSGGGTEAVENDIRSRESEAIEDQDIKPEETEDTKDAASPGEVVNVDAEAAQTGEESVPPGEGIVSPTQEDKASNEEEEDVEPVEETNETENGAVESEKEIINPEQEEGEEVEESLRRKSWAKEMWISLGRRALEAAKSAEEQAVSVEKEEESLKSESWVKEYWKSFGRRALKAAKSAKERDASAEEENTLPREPWVRDYWKSLGRRALKAAKSGTGEETIKSEEVLDSEKESVVLEQEEEKKSLERKSWVRQMWKSLGRRALKAAKSEGIPVQYEEVLESEREDNLKEEEVGEDENMSWAREFWKSLGRRALEASRYEESVRKQEKESDKSEEEATESDEEAAESEKDFANIEREESWVRESWKSFGRRVLIADKSEEEDNPISRERHEESTARLDSEDENEFPVRRIYTQHSEEADSDGRYFHILPYPHTDSEEHSDVRRVGFSDEVPPSKKYLHIDQDEYSPLSSLRSVESNVKDSGYSDDVDREDASSETDDYGSSTSPKYMAKGKPFARFIVTSGAADTFPLEESEEMEESRRLTSRSASMPTIELPTAKRQSPRVLGRLMFNKDMQKTLRRYQLERRLFYELQELKRQQICGGIQEGEFETVQRMAERFKRHVFSAGMTDFRGPYTFTAFEKYLYEQLKNLSLTYKVSTPKECSHHNHSSRSYLSGSDFSSKQGICVCQNHMCHHIRRPRRSVFRSNDRESVRQVILPEISIRRRTTTFKMHPNRSSSWDRTDSSGNVAKSNFVAQQRSPAKFDGSKSLPSLTIPLPKKIPTSLLSAICQRLGPDVHLDDTVVVELSSDEMKGKVRHSFTVREMREAVRQWEEATGRLLKPLHLERVLDPEQKGPVTFEIRHGHERNVFRLPTEKLNGDKKWQVIFTIGKNQRNVPLIAR